MTQRKTKLIHHRDNILTNLREAVWKDGSSDTALHRLARGEAVFGDGNLIITLATIVMAEFAIEDEDAAELSTES